MVTTGVASRKKRQKPPKVTKFTLARISPQCARKRMGDDDGTEREVEPAMRGPCRKGASGSALRLVGDAFCQEHRTVLPALSAASVAYPEKRDFARGLLQAPRETPALAGVTVAVDGSDAGPEPLPEARAVRRDRIGLSDTPSACPA